jgi:hypothetical protein
LPERPKGADCKSAVIDFAGSNPAPATEALHRKPVRGFRLFERSLRHQSETASGDEVTVTQLTVRKVPDIQNGAVTSQLLLVEQLDEQTMRRP